MPLKAAPPNRDQERETRSQALTHPRFLLYCDEFKQAYEYFYEKDHGPLRPVVEKTVDRFLECGIFRHGFVRA